MADLGNNTIFSQTDANNTSGTVPTWQENMAPSLVNDSARALQGAVKRSWDRLNKTIASTGASNNFILTYAVSPAAIYAGERFLFKANMTVTASATVNINGLGVKALKMRKQGVLSNLVANDIYLNDAVEIAYDSTDDCYEVLSRQGGIPAATNAETIAAIINDKAVTPSGLGALWIKSADIASATALSIPDGGVFHVTGTTTITSMAFATPHEGRMARLIFDGVLTLTHSATLVLPGTANITTAAGDSALFVLDAGNVMRCLDFTRASGQAVVSPLMTTQITRSTANSIDTNTTLTNDGILQFALAANTQYVIHAVIFAAVKSASGIKWGLTGPASPATLTVLSTYIEEDGSEIIGGVSAYGQIGATATGTNVDATITLDIAITTGTTAGTFALQFAQNTSSATALTIKAGSSLTYSNGAITTGNSYYVSDRLATTVVSVTALRALTSTFGGWIDLVSYVETGNKGGGIFRYDSTDITSADNGGTIFVDAASHRWKRVDTATLDVFMFGATGDGVTNDSPAIASAIAYVVDGVGGGLYFPPGKYLMNTQVVDTIPVDIHLDLHGAGKDASIIIGNNTSGAIKLSSTQRTSAVTVRGLGFSPAIDGAGTGFEYTVPAGGTQARRIAQIIDCQFVPIDYNTAFSWNMAITLEGMYRPLLRNVICNQGVTATTKMNHIVSLNGAYFPEIIDCYINGPSIYGVKRIGTNEEAFAMYNTVVNGADTGLYIENSSGAQPGMWLDNNHFNCLTNGIHLKGIKLGVISNGLMYSGTGAAATYADILLEDAQSITISGNTYRQNNGANRRHVKLNPAVGKTVKNITIADFNYHATTASAPVYIGPAVDKVEVFFPNLPADYDFGSYPSTLYEVDATATNVLIHQGSKTVNPLATLVQSIECPVGFPEFMATSWSTNVANIWPNMRFRRSDSGVIGTHSALVVNNRVGAWHFEASDGTGFIPVADIVCRIDGTVGTNDMPGRLEFYTTADGAATTTERMRIAQNGFVTLPGGSLGRGAPVTKTADFTVADTENWLINNKAAATCTVTLPAAASFSGREIMLLNYQAFTVVSATANVVPLAGGAAGTAILAATAGKYATLVSNGTNWLIMNAN